MKPREYVKRFRDFITERLRGTTLLPSIVMAHAMYESADDDNTIGKSEHAASYNNDVRILADRSWDGPKVKLPVRQVHGTDKWESQLYLADRQESQNHVTEERESLSRTAKKQRRKAWYRVYSNAENAICDRITMLTTKLSKWPVMVNHRDTIRAQALLIQQLATGTDPRYGERLVYLISEYKLYRLDRQWLLEKLKKFILLPAVLALVAQTLKNWDLIKSWILSAM